MRAWKYYKTLQRGREARRNPFGDFRGLKKERPKIVSETFLEAGAYKVSCHVIKTTWRRRTRPQRFFLEFWQGVGSNSEWGNGVAIFGRDGNAHLHKPRFRGSFRSLECIKIQNQLLFVGNLCRKIKKRFCWQVGGIAKPHGWWILWGNNNFTSDNLHYVNSANAYTKKDKVLAMMITQCYNSVK